MKPPTTIDALTSGRRPGRPPVDQPLSTVSVRLAPTDHDRLIKLANRRGETLSEFLRGVLARRTPSA